jgi:hypothetical protein
MVSRARSKAIQGLIAGTLAWLSYFPDADAGVPESPDPFVDALVSEAESGKVDLLDRQSVLRRLALSPSQTVRARVAEAAGKLSPDDSVAGLSLLRQLSHDAAGEVRSAAARGLAHFIQHAPDPLRWAVESDWTTAATMRERVALARAIGMSAPDWLTEFALLELAADPRLPVRRAALEAARQQIARNPAAYVQLAAAHSGDRDRRVRKAARRALHQIEVQPKLGALRPSTTAVRESRKRFRRALHDSRPDPGRLRPA